MLSSGRTQAPVALLYHAEAEWCGKAMLDQKPARVLLDNQIDFHIVPTDVFVERDFYRTEITDVLTVNGHRHETLVIPYAQFITRETAETVTELLQNRGRVLFLDGLPDGLCTGEDLPEALCSCQIVPLDGLAAELDGLRTVRLEPANDRIRVLHSVGGREFFYLFHEGDRPYQGAVTLPEGEYYRYDPWHDRCQAAEARNGQLHIQLAPSESLFLIRGTLPADAYAPPVRGEKLPLTRFTQSICRAIDYPKFEQTREIDSLESYAKTDRKFSGFIRYETCFDRPAHTLEITDAYEGVEVFLNGRSLGIQVAAPFVYDLRPYVKEGGNRLVIEVATTLERERSNGKSAFPTGITGQVALYLGAH